MRKKNLFGGAESRKALKIHLNIEQFSEAFAKFAARLDLFTRYFAF